ncbi:MAG: beta-galactosidase [Ruminococcaceae bacterium]|nr:beta-galactosidase [Oscillospiraceae bacterium]
MGIVTIKDDKFLMDGKPYRIISGAMHYFRIVPQYWEDRLKKLKACGFNTVETYTCWNLHERKEGVFDFSGILDIEKYIETAAKLGLNVIVRPGPYICAEWELGGLPSWLLSYPEMSLRCNDPLYLEKVKPYYRQLLSRIKPHLATNGGNVIMMQVENEYGSYGNDKEYLKQVENIYRENGIDCLLFTSDGTTEWMLAGGTLPHLLAVANFGSHPKENFESLRRFRQGEPLMCGEFWSGWFDHWYDDHHTRTTADIAKDTKALIDSGASFNFYMFHGGTNFGFMNGANYITGDYQPTITSYDYCAPLSEAGDLTPTFYRLKEMFAQLPDAAKSDYEVENLPKKAYGKIELTHCAYLLEQKNNISQPVVSPQPKTMEQIGQDFGYILYSTILKGPINNLKLNIGNVHDRAQVFVDDWFAGYEERTHHKDEIVIYLEKDETAKLDILVENMGRINYGEKLSDRKGILGGVRLGAQFHFGWENYPLTMENLSGLEWSELENQRIQHKPVFLKGVLNIDDTPCDTFVELEGFTKGFVKVNGFNIGRYFNPAGPQKTLYIPAPLLKKGENEIIVFESDGFEQPVIEFKDIPDLG